MPLKYSHPTIVVDEPAPGHYAINGHNPKSVFIEGEGHIVPPHITYISPEVPSELLEAILVARGYRGQREDDRVPKFEDAPSAPADAPAPAPIFKQRGRPRKQPVGETTCGAEV